MTICCTLYTSEVLLATKNPLTAPSKVAALPTADWTSNELFQFYNMAQESTIANNESIQALNENKDILDTWSDALNNPNASERVDSPTPE
jgi:hypothetical protein